MNALREFLYFIEVKEKNGSKTKFPVYRGRKKYFIGDHPVRAGKSIEDELKEFFHVEVIGPVVEIPAHLDLRFKNIRRSTPF